MLPQNVNSYEQEFFGCSFKAAGIWVAFWMLEKFLEEIKDSDRGNGGEMELELKDKA